MRATKATVHLATGFGSPSAAEPLPTPPKIVRLTPDNPVTSPVQPPASTSLNPHLVLPPRVDRAPAVVAALPAPIDRNLTAPYKWMFSTPSQRADALDARVAELEQAFVTNFKPAFEKGELPPVRPPPTVRPSCLLFSDARARTHTLSVTW